MSRFLIKDTALQGLKAIERTCVGDDRGYLSRLFCSAELHSAGWQFPIAQINHTFTRKRGLVRGMHYQNFPDSEDKLVTCIRGEIWDVAVDLRAGSSTFLRWYGRQLSKDNQTALLIPKGFAHGFQALSDEVEMIYLHSKPYVADSDAGIQPIDPTIGICWPLPIAKLSAKDSNYPLIYPEFEGVKV
jgi:dTDP-4-dehydrorhamnose 3,5-epimerase